MKLYVLHSDRVYEFLRHSDYSRKDGTLGRVAYWRSSCRMCGAAFEISTSANVGTIAASKAFGRVHCDAGKGLSKAKKADRG